jgi:hypothetical protein
MAVRGEGTTPPASGVMFVVTVACRVPLSRRSSVA